MPVKKSKLVKAVGIGTAASFAVMLAALCLICGLMMMLSAIPFDSLPYITLIAAAAGVFAGGYISAAITGSGGLIVGVLCGAASFLVLLLIGLCAGTSSPGAVTIIRLIVCVLFGALGGVKGVNRREKLHIK